MPLFKKINLGNGSLLGIWNVEESIDELQSRLMLNEQELIFFNNLKKGKRNLHWLAGRVMLRTLLETNEFIDVKEDEFGKPYLCNFDFEISITHSYDFAGVIISKNKAGIDIEKIKKDLWYLAPKFLSAKEMNDIESNNRIKQLYIYWCVKESIYKLYGKKELAFRQNIIVNGFDYAPKGSVMAEIRKNGLHLQYEVYFEEFVAGYMLAYVLEK